MRDLSVQRSLFRELIGLAGLLQCREILSAWAGMKVARIAVKPPLLNQTIACLNQLELVVHILPDLIFAKRDIGKGGWSNKYDERPGLHASKGDYAVFVSTSNKKLTQAVNADIHGDEGEFGAKLGIPSCCVDFYLTNQAVAYQKQNDFVPMVAANTEGLYAFNFWNNYVSQYFGYSYLSFFPCSFNCEHAALMAQTTHDLMHSLLPSEADEIVHFQKQPILYTEYRGIYLFEGAKFEHEKTTIKDSMLHSTLNPNKKSHQFVSRSREIRVLAKGELQFTMEDKAVQLVKNRDWVMCTFI
jgi:hypothetical protein